MTIMPLYDMISVADPRHLFFPVDGHDGDAAPRDDEGDAATRDDEERRHMK